MESAREGHREGDEFAPDDYQSDTTSLKPGECGDLCERGRRYAVYKGNQCLMPNDDIEQGREDMKHIMLLELTDGNLFFAPIGTYPQKILDIGTGTGKASNTHHPWVRLIANRNLGDRRFVFCSLRMTS